MNADDWGNIWHKLKSNKKYMLFIIIAAVNVVAAVIVN